LNKYFIYGLCITSGVLLGVFFCNFSYFEFDKSIKITDIIYWIITSTVGLYIAINVNKVFQKNHSEKDIIILEIKTIIKSVDKMIFFIKMKRLPFETIKAQFKEINEHLNLLDTLIKESHCSTLSLSNHKKKLHELRRLITGLSPTNGFIILKNSNFNDISKNAREFKVAFYKLIFAINKC
jgi:hypothetical protein